mmetsp:Transcript_912/g.2220  ORF Transcript_912/g.2220 Transcript_912/m.2220 type:complete len:217 (-) Transcript_912:51-701(-)
MAISTPVDTTSAVSSDAPPATATLPTTPPVLRTSMTPNAISGTATAATMRLSSTAAAHSRTPLLLLDVALRNQLTAPSESSTIVANSLTAISFSASSSPSSAPSFAPLTTPSCPAPPMAPVAAPCAASDNASSESSSTRSSGLRSWCWFPASLDPSTGWSRVSCKSWARLSSRLIRPETGVRRYWPALQSGPTHDARHATYAQARKTLMVLGTRKV